MSDTYFKLGQSTMTPTDNVSRKEVVLPGQASKDFILNAECRIIKVGTRVKMSATDLPGESGGAYEWSTTSSKIRLVNTTGNIVAVEALDTPGSARDSETVSVTRTGPDGRRSQKTVDLTVAKVVFGPSRFQNFGYDDMDSPDRDDDHVSVASGDFTFVHVDILGGAGANDFEFVCDDQAICRAMSTSSTVQSFELRIEAGRFTKAATALRAKARCPAKTVFASITLHVYAWAIQKAVIGKFWDSTAPNTTLKFMDGDYTSHKDRANNLFKEAVVAYELENTNSNKAISTAIPQKNGEVVFDMASNGKALREALLEGFDEQEDGTYLVAVIRNMKSYYYLNKSAKKGSTAIEVTADRILTSKLELGKGATAEWVTIECTEKNIGYLKEPLKFDHAKNETVSFPAGAWSGTPMILVEGNFSEEELRWVLLHEFGHTALTLKDVDDQRSIMSSHGPFKDYRLRYIPRELHYAKNADNSANPKCMTSVGKNEKAAPTESQWEKIPRPAPVKDE